MNALCRMLARRRMRRHPGTYRLAADLTRTAVSDAPETADETPREDRKS